jgi:hypothetical protein
MSSDIESRIAELASAVAVREFISIRPETVEAQSACIGASFHEGVFFLDGGDKIVLVDRLSFWVLRSISLDARSRP